MSKTIADEIIVAALIENGTAKKAAAALGISEKTIQNRMKETDFICLYDAAKLETIRGATLTLNSKLAAAIDTITEIMTDKETAAQTRLNAAQTILNNAYKITVQLNEYERHERDEHSKLVLDLAKAFYG